jgi:hypothetical protein
VASTAIASQTGVVQYFRRVPAPPLDRFIDDIYCLTGVPRHRRLNVPPMPSAHFMVNLATPIRLYDSDPAVEPAALGGGWFTGLWSRRFAIEHDAHFGSIRSRRPLDDPHVVLQGERVLHLRFRSAGTPEPDKRASCARSSDDPHRPLRRQE